MPSTQESYCTHSDTIVVLHLSASGVQAQVDFPIYEHQQKPPQTSPLFMNPLRRDIFPSHIDVHEEYHKKESFVW